MAKIYLIVSVLRYLAISLTIMNKEDYFIWKSSSPMFSWYILQCYISYLLLTVPLVLLPCTAPPPPQS